MIDINKRIEEVKKRLELEELAFDEFDVEEEMAYERMLEEENKVKKMKRKNEKSHIDWEKRIFVNEGKTYTFDELYEIYLKNESFEGKVANIKNIEKYNRLEKYAYELKEVCEDVTNMVLSPPEKNSRWASVHIDFVWMMRLGEKEKIDLIEKMMSLSDSFSINGSSFSTVRLSFDIKDIWEK